MEYLETHSGILIRRDRGVELIVESGERIDLNNTAKNCIPLSDDQVRQRLKTLARKKEYQHASEIKLLNGSAVVPLLDETLNGFRYYPRHDELATKGWVIYRAGNWSEITRYNNEWIIEIL